MRRLHALVAAVVLTAATSLTLLGSTLLAGPAQAAACGGSTGVTVVVDFNDLGGGVQSACVADGGGRTASTLFTQAGFTLSYAQRQPGFVCRVNGVPASDPCQNTAPASAYWGLWSSSGNPGSSWTYASLGAGSLTVPDGGLVAFSWDDVSGDAQPSAPATRPATSAPPTNQPTSQPTSRPTGQPTSRPSHQPTGRPTGSPSSPASPASSATSGDPSDPATAPIPPTTAPGSGGPTGRAPGSPGTATVGPGPTGGDPSDGSTSAEPPSSVTTTTTTPTAGQQTSGGGLPGWVAPAVIVVLLAGVGAALARRRTRP